MSLSRDDPIWPDWRKRMDQDELVACDTQPEPFAILFIGNVKELRCHC